MLLRLLLLVLLALLPAQAFAQLNTILRKGDLSLVVSTYHPPPTIAHFPTWLVSVDTKDPATEAFRVTLVYTANNKTFSSTSLLQRGRWTTVSGASEHFWAPEGARLLSVRVEELKAVEFTMSPETP